MREAAFTPAMNVSIKTPEEQDRMRVAGRLAADVLDMIGEHVVPGVTTDELDQLCHDYIVNHQRAIPANLHYKGYPKTICASVNHVVCHEHFPLHRRALSRPHGRKRARLRVGSAATS